MKSKRDFVQTAPARLRIGELYVLCVPLMAGIAAINGTSLTIAGFNYTGYLWVIAMVFGCGLLLVEKTLNPANQASFSTAPWLLWLSWVGISFTWLDDVSYKQIQDAMQLSMPVLVGILASLFINSRERLAQLVKVYFYTGTMLALFVGIWLAGVVTDAANAAVSVAIRPLSLTAIVIGGLFIAGCKRNALIAWIGWSACLALTVATGSRMASVTMLMLPIINPVTRHWPRKLAALLVIGVLAAGLFSTPIMQQRFFHGGSGNLNAVLRGEFDSAGRFETWPIVLEESLKRPWLGHGEGSVGALIADVWEDQAHPHNDYLRVAYELGAVGLALFLTVLVWQLWNLNCWIHRTDGVVQQAFAGAWLALAAFTVVAFTDNPIIYNLYYMNPVFALMGAAYRVARNEASVSAAELVTRPLSSRVSHRSGPTVLERRTTTQ